MSPSRGASSAISSTDAPDRNDAESVAGRLGWDALENDQIVVGTEVLYDFNEFGGE